MAITYRLTNNYFNPCTLVLATGNQITVKSGGVATLNTAVTAISAVTVNASTSQYRPSGAWPFPARNPGSGPPPADETTLALFFDAAERGGLFEIFRVSDAKTITYSLS